MRHHPTPGAPTCRVIQALHQRQTSILGADRNAAATRAHGRQESMMDRESQAKRA